MEAVYYIASEDDRNTHTASLDGTALKFVYNAADLLGALACVVICSYKIENKRADVAGSAEFLKLRVPMSRIADLVKLSDFLSDGHLRKQLGYSSFDILIHLSNPFHGTLRTFGISDAQSIKLYLSAAALSITSRKLKAKNLCRESGSEIAPPIPHKNKAKKDLTRHECYCIIMLAQIYSAGVAQR